jgi:hypothetical protein
MSLSVAIEQQPTTMVETTNRSSQLRSAKAALSGMDTSAGSLGFSFNGIDHRS